MNSLPPDNQRVSRRSNRPGNRLTGRPTPKPAGRRWALRLLALVLGCLPLVMLELGLRLAGWPAQSPPVDPLVDLHHLRPLFALSADGQSYHIGPERMDLFRPARFAARKRAGSFRIFALGGSTTQGEPYSTPTAFPAWLELYLREATDRPIEVINCGGLSYASYRVRAILDEVLQYQPDLIVIYTGQNEFLERRSYAGWREVPLPIARASSWLSSFKTSQALRYLARGSADRPHKHAFTGTEMASEVDALLDYAGGLEEYHRDDPWREPVVEHFRFNLAQMLQRCQIAGVPVVLMRPVVNLLDCPPMKFETRSDLEPGEQTRFDLAWQAAREGANDVAVAREYLQRAYEIDPEHAGVNFFLGRLAWEAGEVAQARKYLVAAKDNDVCPLRALSSIQDAVVEMATRFSVPMLDAEQVFSERSPHGLVGDKWLVDHVHPSIEGHQLLGQELCQLVLDQGWLAVTNGQWRATSQTAVLASLKTLHEDYFHRGKQRLAGLILWTQGRAKKIRPTPPMVKVN